MKWNQFIGGLFLGCAFGLLIGAATVRLPDDGSGKREYPFGPALLFAIVGGVSARGRALFPRRNPPPGKDNGAPN
jgi:hypothetical protein